MQCQPNVPGPTASCGCRRGSGVPEDHEAGHGDLGGVHGAQHSVLLARGDAVRGLRGDAPQEDYCRAGGGQEGPQLET